MNNPEHAALTAAFAARRCLICGAPADVVCPGGEAVYADSVAQQPDGSTRRLRRVVSAATPDLNLCLPHAAERWPWHGEKPRTRRCAR